MTPTYTKEDIKRISAHFNQTPQQFSDKWLIYEKRDKDWQNKKQPCQFLNLKDNKCSIYEIRPVDCSGFPHLPKRKMLDYMHVHKQNIEYCPATYKLVEKMEEFMEPDRAKHAVLPISKFGIMQITRQRMKPEMNINTQEVCPSCNGTGKISSTILLEDEIEKNLTYLITHQHKNLKLVVNPIMYAYLTQGWFWKTKMAAWKKKLKQKI